MKKCSLKRVVSLLLTFAFGLCFSLSVPVQAAERCALSTITQSSGTRTLSTEAGNHDPIVLVHGLFGWGNTEIAHSNYWGGTDSLRDLLKEKGYTVYTPTIGPVSSNWDRACELYAYLVGGTVDYGLAHSRKYGHARYGSTFTGVLPQLMIRTVI